MRAGLNLPSKEKIFNSLSIPKIDSALSNNSQSTKNNNKFNNKSQ